METNNKKFLKRFKNYASREYLIPQAVAGIKKLPPYSGGNSFMQYIFRIPYTISGINRGCFYSINDDDYLNMTLAIEFICPNSDVWHSVMLYAVSIIHSGSCIEVCIQYFGLPRGINDSPHSCPTPWNFTTFLQGLQLFVMFTAYTDTLPVTTHNSLPS